GSGRLDTRLDTPPLSTRHHPLSRIAPPKRYRCTNGCLAHDMSSWLVAICATNLRTVRGRRQGEAQIHKQTIFREFSMRNCESVLKPVWELAFSILIEAHLLICAELVRNRALGICYGAVVEVAAQAHCKKVHKRRPTID
ncbi:hypothetical protein, partial [Bradyrhizobium sp. Leaf401]